jgi:hypothetical protein
LINNLVLLVSLQGLYPDPHTDVEVLSGDDDASKIDASTANLKAPNGDDAKGEGASSMELVAPGPISSNAPAQAVPSVADWVALSVPSAGGQKQKLLPPVPKCKSIKSSTDQVMIQIELPLYRGPQSPLDLVAIEIFFGHLFEAF